MYAELCEKGEKGVQSVQTIFFHSIHSVYVHMILPGLLASPEGCPSEYLTVLGEI